MRCRHIVFTAVFIAFLSGCIKREVPAYVKNLEEKKAEEITALENIKEKYDFFEEKEKQAALAAKITDLEKELKQFESFENIEKKELEFIESFEKNESLSDEQETEEEVMVK